MHVLVLGDAAEIASIFSAVAAGVLAVLTGCYLWATMRMTNAAQVSAEQAKVSAQAAVESAQAAQHQLELQQRPVVVLGRPGSNKSPVRWKDGTLGEVADGRVTAWLDTGTTLGYLAFHLRNVGTGMAALKAIDVYEELDAPSFPPDIRGVNWNVNNLLIPPGETRPYRGTEVGELALAIGDLRSLVFDFVYTDLNTSQAAVTRVVLETDGGEYHPFFSNYQPLTGLRLSAPAPAS